MIDFYFPDSQDQVDPRFDFIEEQHPVHHVRQRDDVYAHEALTRGEAFQGILVSKGIVDGLAGASGRYTIAQRHRLYRVGAHRFFRLPTGMKALGDCGAFSYVDEEEPPITPDEAINFYEGCRFDAGISVDHIILGFSSDRQPKLIEDEQVAAWRQRQQITLDNATQFLKAHAANGCRFEPIGAAQGWSPTSYAESVAALQQIGYQRIAMGGMVPLKTHQVLEVLEAVQEVRRPETRLHLLGLTRTDKVHEFVGFGVASFDSTGPFRQAFMDDTHNYHWPDGAYTAIRVPPVDGSKLKRMVRAGLIEQGQALELEARCLSTLRSFDAGKSTSIDTVLGALADYHALFDQRDRVEEYRRILQDRPWRQCKCGICEQDGIEVAIFRGTERNKRRGFHNIAIFADELAERIRSKSA